MAETRIGVIGCAGRMGRMLVADIAATEGCALAGGTARPGSAGARPGSRRAGRGRPARHRRQRRMPRRCCATATSRSNSPRPTRRPTHAALGRRARQADRDRHDRAVRRRRRRRSAGPPSGCRSSGPPIPASASICCSGWSSRSRHGSGRNGTSRSWRCITAARSTRRPARRWRSAVPRRRRAAPSFDEVAQRGRDGITGPRPAGAIGFAALRGGDNIGEHHVIFAGLGRAAGADPPGDQPRDLCQGRGARRALAGRPPARALRHEGSAGLSELVPAGIHR